MDFELSDEQRMFRDTIRDFVAREVTPVAQEWEHTGRYPAEIVETMKQLGLFGMTVPEEYGGLGLDMVSFAIVFEEISRGWMGVAGILGSHSLACWIIARYGTEEQKSRYLPELATGERRSGIALTEPGAGTDLQGITTRAVRDGDAYVVTGSKTWITNARYADPLPVLVKTDPHAAPAHKGMSVLLVEQGTPGFTVSRDLPKLGYKGPESCEVVLDGARVPAANLLGGVEGRGMQQVLSGLETGRINVAARSLGVAQAAYDAALKYSRDRHAFGQPISDFQAIQIKLADMATSIQASRLLVYWAAACADRGERVDMQTGMAKLFASETAATAALEAMRIHGGHGYSQEFTVERLYRDVPLMVIGEGTSDVMRTVIARALTSGKEKVG
ncbi:acyl-CoA dehydrogenase family protein [Yinghuangia seranimata]|uniref:acyl-CoA dehydrogenase family protein n=1 Tax=Yinghuangia seranimata TaxID=408067 RepID=UPI00248A9CA6|nr:acyl-CoA dehydrogenase family protein [Yinghuangia seranimata]MDI2132446.1 acyl-CoA dehydrogenase family protein [Yinghuangia seranimata]